MPVSSLTFPYFVSGTTEHVVPNTHTCHDHVIHNEHHVGALDLEEVRLPLTADNLQLVNLATCVR